jgi:hypothetical protein
MGMDTNVFAPTMAGTYSAKVVYRNGCSTQTNSIRLGQDTTHFGSDSFVVQNNSNANFVTCEVVKM